MDTLFIETRYKLDAKVDAKELAKLPKKVAVVGSIQYMSAVEKLKVELEKTGRKAVLPKLSHSAYPGQVLGCSIDKISGVDAIIFIGDGKFHPIALSIKNDVPVFAMDFLNGRLELIDPRLGERFEKRKKGAILKFLSAENVGIIVSIKPGQNRKKDAILLQKKLNKKGVGSYLFLSDTLSIADLENFSFIDVFVNTACPRIFYDEHEKFPKPIVNLDDIKDC
jgi:2-(3-amino-3-carboxypropyl)histidine synthase